MVLLGDEAQVEAHMVRLEIVLILMQDRCMICIEHTIGSKSFWMHPMELLVDTGQVESRIGSFGDSFSVSVR
jgi:hypothetical protein